MIFVKMFIKLVEIYRSNDFIQTTTKILHLYTSPIYKRLIILAQVFTFGHQSAQLQIHNSQRIYTYIEKTVNTCMCVCIYIYIYIYIYSGT